MRSHKELKLLSLAAGALLMAAPLAQAAVTPEQLGLSESDLRSSLDAGTRAAIAPGATFGSPVAFGLDWGEAGIGLGGTWDPEAPFKKTDGSLGLALGLGDREKAFGVELGANINSLERQTGAQHDGFGSDGSFSAKLHTSLPSYRAALAVGVENFGRYGDAAKQTKTSVYVVGTKFFSLNPKGSFTFPLGVNIGYGNNRFLRLSNKEESANIFGGLDFVLHKQASLAVDWTGRDLNLGFSFVPFVRIPVVATIGGINLTHQDDQHAAYAGSLSYLFSF